MPVQFKISITKEIIERSKYCPAYDNDTLITGENCAIALALKDLFPNVFVSGLYILPLGNNCEGKERNIQIDLPEIAKNFIKVFDSLSVIPNIRPLLPEFEFEISIPDEIISLINIDEVRKIIEENSADNRARVAVLETLL